MKTPLVLIGCGGHARSVIDIIELSGNYEIVALVDTPEKMGESVLGYKIEYTDTDLENLAQEHGNFVVTLGQIKSYKRRQEYFDKIKSLGGQLPVIISPLAHVSKHSSIDEGTVILSHALVNAGARIGKNCIINSKALIEHDVIVGDNCHISTATVVNGSTKVGSGSFLGSNTVTREAIEIGKDKIIGAGEKIMKDLL